jgi:hypothetical protein
VLKQLSLKEIEMAHFYSISKQEMEELLFGDLGFLAQHNPLPLDHGEFVYGKRLEFGIVPVTLRIYSSITRSGIARESGGDAIRVALLAKRPDGEVRGIGKAKRVHRVLGWRKNLTSRVKEMESKLKDIESCDKCGLPMAVRKSKSGADWMGCTGFPACRFTKNV